jgi:hypothetical protein
MSSAGYTGIPFDQIEFVSLEAMRGTGTLPLLKLS